MATDHRTVEWLTPEQLGAWVSYIETQGDLMTALERDFETTGLSLGDYQVFVYLSATPDELMRMCDLAEMLQLSPSGLTRRLDGLVGSGWVERRPSDEDRRVMLAVLTPSGREVLERAAPVHVDSVRRRMFDHLDDTDVAALATIFRKIRSALDA